MAKIGCPFCTGGTVTETQMTGDGQPNVPVEIHTKEYECEFCDGSSQIDEEKLEN